MDNLLGAHAHARPWSTKFREMPAERTHAQTHMLEHKHTQHAHTLARSPCGRPMAMQGPTDPFGREARGLGIDGVVVGLEGLLNLAVVDLGFGQGLLDLGQANLVAGLVVAAVGVLVHAVPLDLFAAVLDLGQT